jgi:hypothetical protein
MRNINAQMHQYRDAVCHLWNAYFLNASDWSNLTECEPRDSYEAIDRRLFFALVCYPLNISFDWGWGEHLIEDPETQDGGVRDSNQNSRK